MLGDKADISSTGDGRVGEPSEKSLAEWTKIWRQLAPAFSERDAAVSLTNRDKEAATVLGCNAWASPETSRLLDILARQPSDFSEQRISLVAAIRQSVIEHDATVDPSKLERVLSAMLAVPRELFVHSEVPEFAYLPTSLDIGSGQTISNPHLVATMTLAANLPCNANVLDIGTGSGYQAAILSLIAKTVTTIEILPVLARAARDRLRNCGYHNVEVRESDGFAGAPDRAPFDAIIVAAAAACVPGPLLEQLAPQGRLIMPLGPSPECDLLTVVTSSPSGEIVTRSLGGVRFVPLTGKGRR